MAPVSADHRYGPDNNTGIGQATAQDDYTSGRNQPIEHA
jgi:hypothetical protein